MQSNLEKEIEELKRQLEDERASMHGNAQQQRQKMQAEIDELKR